MVPCRAGRRKMRARTAHCILDWLRSACGRQTSAKKRRGNQEPPAADTQRQSQQRMPSIRYSRARTRRSPIFAIRCVRCAAETTASRHSPSRYTRLLVNARDARAAVTGAREVAGGDGLAHVGREGRRDVRREEREQGLPCSAGSARHGTRDRVARNNAACNMPDATCDTPRCDRQKIMYATAARGSLGACRSVRPRNERGCIAGKTTCHLHRVLSLEQTSTSFSFA